MHAIDKENLADAYEMADKMKEKFGFEIGLAYSTSGCTFTCLQADLESKELPSIFINVVRPLVLPLLVVLTEFAGQEGEEDRFQFARFEEKECANRFVRAGDLSA